MRWVVAMGVIDTLAVMLRLLVRKKNGTNIAADDWMIMASLVPAYCMIVTASLCELLLFSLWTNQADQLTTQVSRKED